MMKNNTNESEYLKSISEKLTGYSDMSYLWFIENFQKDFYKKAAKVLGDISLGRGENVKARPSYSETLDSAFNVLESYCLIGTKLQYINQEERETVSNAMVLIFEFIKASLQIKDTLEVQ